MEQRDKGNLRLINDIHRLDPDGGVLVHMTCWRPRAGDPDPEEPGEKVFITIYHPTRAQDACPCGSGKRFGDCCQPLPYWRLLCPNPDMQGYSLLRPQSARFTRIAGDEIYAALRDDQRLYCVEDTPQRVFWTYWGDPAFDIPQGTLCFGDIELLENHTMLVTALSDVRMGLLLDLVRPLKLGAPHVQVDPSSRLEKPVRKDPAGKRRRKS